MKQFFLIAMLLFANLVMAQKHEANEASNLIGQECTIVGEVVDTFQDRETSTVFLNFGKAYPNQVFTVVIFEQHQQYFNFNLLGLEGKRIEVKGLVELYRGRPQIEINRWWNLRVLN